MQTAYISFCDKQALNIKSSDIKEVILERLDGYGVKIIDKHHEIYSDKHINRISRIPHLLYVKSNGNPYYMFMTRINFVNTVILIDKKVQMGYALPRMIISRITIKDDTLFNDTLLEGEMVKTNTGSWLFLLSDLLVMKKKSLRDDDLIKRFNNMYQILEDSYIPHWMDMFSFQIKKMFECKDASILINDFVPSLPYTCRGVYCKPLYLKFKNILYNFDDSLVKSVQKHTYKEFSHFISSPSEIVSNKQQDANPSKSESKQKQNSFNDTYDIDVDSPCSLINDDMDFRLFNIQKSDTPDVYKLYDNMNECNGNGCACVTI